MSDFLGRIIEHKKEEIAAAAKTKPESVLRAEAEKPLARRPFMKRLASPGPYGMNVIAEIKRASPSKGPIRDVVDPAAYARMYEQGGAAAISVLTDRDYFGGTPEDLKKARAASNLPVLRKDFLISAYQVYEAAAMGADAMLLIVRALEPSLLRDLITLAGDLGLDALVEVHNESEFETAEAAGATLIGVNNRDLVTFKTDIQTSLDLARRAAPGRVLVAESGIHGRAQIEQLTEAGISNFLIGESIMRADDPVRMLKTLHGVDA